MPTTQTIEITALAHCPNPRCPGYRQEEVKAIRDETHFRYTDFGGDSPGIERSQVYMRFADPDEQPCTHCGLDREVTDQPRVQYNNLSGFAQDGLLTIKPPEHQ